MSDMTHFDSDGNAHMVDVGEKVPTRRTAIATGTVVMLPGTLTKIREGSMSKGDVLSVARLAGIMSAKKTPDLIPLCHSISVSSVEIEFQFESDDRVKIQSKVVAVDRTGVEMEAMTSVTVAALTIYDMCKSIDRNMKIESIQLDHKSGGKSGTFDRATD